MDDWNWVEAVEPPQGKLLETYNEHESNGARATNECYWRPTDDGEGGEWMERGPPFGSGRTTVTHSTFLAPTHWRLARPRDLGIELNKETARAFGNRVRDTPGVPGIGAGARARLLWWAHCLAQMAAALKAEAAEYNQAGLENEGLLTIRLQLSVEETGEWAEALASGDIERAFNELVDMSVVTDGHYLTLGLADLKRAGYREVMGANMSKLGEDGKPIISEAGRWMKGPNFRKPDMGRVLRGD